MNKSNWLSLKLVLSSATWAKPYSLPPPLPPGRAARKYPAELVRGDARKYYEYKRD
jgi:hypothetical protein